MRSPYSDIQTFVFFVGYPRSGHSLLGACLDAHPNAVISHELDALSLLIKGTSKLELFDAICEKAHSFYAAGSVWSGYSYDIPAMFQGRYETIKVIGDKRGGTSSSLLKAHPEVLDVVKNLAPNYKIIHLVRNPFDCISTSVMKREIKQQKLFTVEDLMRKAGHFFEKAEVIEKLIDKEKDAVLSIRHEDLVRNPLQTLTEVCNFLDLPVFDAYLEACQSKIWTTTNKSRHKINLWNDYTIKSIQEKIDRFSFFNGYTFTS